MLSNPLDIIDQALSLDVPFSLIVVTEISGGTLRSKGALMLVSEREAWGYISSGCVDGDIIFQARQAIVDGQIRKLIYGENSPFKDIVLPCGGTIKINIYPNPDRTELAKVWEATQDRKPASLSLPGFVFEYNPQLSLRVVGRGAPFIAMAELAQVSGFQIHGQSPDPELRQDYFWRFDHLKNPDNIFDVFQDPWSAVVFLFHDHEWEPSLLRQALEGQSFYIGAMGSERTHKLRRETLSHMGVSNSERIHGPIGLIPAMRDANRLAVSVLAEIIEQARLKGRLS